MSVIAFERSGTRLEVFPALSSPMKLIVAVSPTARYTFDRASASSVPTAYEADAPKKVTVLVATRTPPTLTVTTPSPVRPSE